MLFAEHRQNLGSRVSNKVILVYGHGSRRRWAVYPLHICFYPSWQNLCTEEEGQASFELRPTPNNAVRIVERLGVSAASFSAAARHAVFCSRINTKQTTTNDGIMAVWVAEHLLKVDRFCLWHMRSSHSGAAACVYCRIDLSVTSVDLMSPWI